AWKPALRRLETIESVDQMEQDDYAEAWAWVHFLLETSETRRSWLRAYVHDLRVGGDVEPLSHRVAGSLDATERQLITHVRQLGVLHARTPTE
ncbi:MAG: hypothetical protein ACC645_07805, partial [Pirellulales bacterium]